jgi:hypothetical protein
MPGANTAPEAQLWPGHKPSSVISRKVITNPDGSTTEIAELGP